MHKHRVEQLGGTYLSTMAPLAVSGVGLSAGSLTTAVVLGFCLAFFLVAMGEGNKGGVSSERFVFNQVNFASENFQDMLKETLKKNLTEQNN